MADLFYILVEVQLGWLWLGISASLCGIGTVTCGDQGACVCGERQRQPGHWKTCRWVYRMVAGDTMLFKGNNSHVGVFEVKACIMSSEAHGRYDW